MLLPFPPSFLLLFFRSIIEIQRTFVPLIDITMKRAPFWILMGVISHSIINRAYNDGILIALIVIALYWAIRIQRNFHYVDVWAFGLTGLAIFMALHQAAYHKLGAVEETAAVGGKRPDDLFKVGRWEEEEE